MFEEYKVAVHVSLRDEATAGLGLLAKHLLTAQGAAASLQKKLGAIRGLFVGGGALFGTGAALAAPLLYAVDKAAELQKQMLSIQIATRGTTGQMDSMRMAIEKIAGVTVFSNIDIAKQAKIIATGTGLGAAQVQSLLPVYAKYADVQLLMKGTPYEQSITDVIRAAHGAQHYDAASLTAYANLLTKASLIVPGSVSEVVRALGYFQGVAKTALGSNDEQNVLAVALTNRLGFAGTRGGTNLSAAFTRTIPGVFGSGLLTGKSHEALSHMGMIDSAGHAKVFTNGKFDVLKWMGLTADYVAREFAMHPEAIARQDIMTDFQHGYGTIGSRIPAMLGSDNAIAQWKQLASQFAEYGGFEGMQQKFADESVAQQWMNAKTNFVSAMTEIGITLLPTASKALKKLNEHLQTMIEWITKNPAEVKEYAINIGKTAIALGALGALSWVAGSILTLKTAIGLLGSNAIRTSAQIEAAGLTSKFSLMANGAANLGLALGTGFAVGSLIWSFMEGTKYADQLGEAIARVFAFFGSKDAKAALDANGRSPGQSTFFDTVGSLATLGVVPTIANMVAGHFGGQGGSSGGSPSLSGYVSPLNQPINLHATANVLVDGNVVGTAALKFINKQGSRPQTGISSADFSQAPIPAGGMGFAGGF